MASQVRVFNNAEALADGNKLAAFATSVDVVLGRTSGDATTINSGTEISCPILKTGEASVSGLTSDENFEADIFNIFASSAGLVSFSFMNSGAGPGSKAVFSTFGLSSFGRPNDVSDFQKFDLALETNDEIYRGDVANNQIVNAVGPLTALNFGQILATEKLIARIHLTSSVLPTDTIDVKLESDVDNTFLTPTDRIIFPQFVGRSVNTVAIDGPVTDGWFRFNATALSVGGSFDLVAMLAKSPK